VIDPAEVARSALQIAALFRTAAVVLEVGSGGRQQPGWRSMGATGAAARAALLHART
jgi:hypothetical protein